MEAPVDTSDIDPRFSSGSRRVRYPFAAVVGHRAAKQALLLLAIEPRLRGVLIASESGSAGSTLARAIGSLLPRPDEDCARGRSDRTSGFELDNDAVEVPLNVGEDRLLGGLDLERTIATGKPEMSTGLLARANGRVLFVNEVNLLDSGASAHVANALDSRSVRLEREGLSATHDADFRFVGTYNPDEGEPSSLLRDRVGLIVDAPEESSADEKAEIIDRAFCFDRDPFSFADDFASKTAFLKQIIEEARRRLPRIRISNSQVRQIAQIAIGLGVEGNRMDLFAVQAARANAALSGRDSVTEDDVVAAIQLVLVPRATTYPAAREEVEKQNESSPTENLGESNHPNANNTERDSVPGRIDDVIIRAIDASLPKELLSPSYRMMRPPRAGKRFKASKSTRGRYVLSAINRTPEARVAIDATLRAAAPRQLCRRGQVELKESATEILPGRVRLKPSDLRFKRFKQRSGILFIFAVDASGSMSLNRMAQAKGALTRLLQQAYIHRDKVALISFRGAGSDVLLSPTRSVELAKRLVDALPAGGGTPVAAGVVKAIELARRARLRGTSQAMLVLFTDGRANVLLGDGRAAPTASTIGEELRHLGALLGAEEIKALVVDTKSRFVSSGEGEALARMLGARYFYLPRPDSGAVSRVIVAATGRPRQRTDD